MFSGKNGGSLSGDLYFLFVVDGLPHFQVEPHTGGNCRAAYNGGEVSSYHENHLNQ